MGGYPIRLFPLRGLGTEVDVHRAVTVFLQSRRLRGAAGPLCIAYQRVSLAVVDRRRPVLPDGCIRWNVEPVNRTAAEAVAILVLEGHQVRLPCTEVLGAEEAKCVGGATAVDGIRIRIGVEGRQAL